MSALLTLEKFTTSLNKRFRAAVNDGTGFKDSIGVISACSALDTLIRDIRSGDASVLVDIATSEEVTTVINAFKRTSRAEARIQLDEPAGLAKRIVVRVRFYIKGRGAPIHHSEHVYIENHSEIKGFRIIK